MNSFLLQAINPNVSVSSVLPEIIVALTGIIVMLYDCVAPRQRKVTGVIALIGLILAAASIFFIWNNDFSNAWNGMVRFDNLRVSFTLVMLFVSALTILISTVWVEREDIPIGEYHSLLLFATVGMTLMSAGNDMVIIFLGLETLSIATYVMAGLRRTDLRSNEAAIKYFILGAFSSAFLLYGMALIYGATASTNLTEIAAKIASSSTNFPALLLVGGAMLLIGFGFKVATAPFHVWTPDVYEGAPTPITAFMATGPKTAAFASFVRVFVLGFPFAYGANAAGVLSETWITALSVMAIITMFVGNIGAIVQDNVKRMLAYSSIAHAGYASVGLIGAGVAQTADKRDEAIIAVAFYMLTYAVTNLGAFAIVTLLGQRSDRRTEFADYNGIGFKSPVLAFSLSLFMLSLVGLPLTAGFMGKIMVFRPALDAQNPLLTLLVVIAVINTAISAYYYLRLIVVMFFKERVSEWREPAIPASIAAVLFITVFGVFFLGIFSDWTLNLFRSLPVSETVTAIANN